MKVCVLGGGIAGLAAAIALAQRAHQVEVFERRSEPGGLGAGVVCWPNAVFVLEQLGLRERVLKAGGLPRSMRRLTAVGEELGVLDLQRLNRALGQPSVSVLRRDLHEALLGRAAQLGVRLHLGREVCALERVSAGRARARFADGGACEADLFLGAEGRMRSIARGYVCGSAAPVYQGFVNWVGVYRGEEALFSDMAIRDYWGVGERFGIVPVSPVAAYWAGAEARPAARPPSRSGHRAHLQRLFAAWPDPIRQVLERSPEEQTQEVYVFDHDPLERWQRDNVLLIGDAAHAALPTSGQGACQALEDAWHLGRLLDGSLDLEEACTAFTDLRREKTAAIAEGGRRLARALFSTSPAACEQRDADARSADYAAMADGMARFWGAGLLELRKVSERGRPKALTPEDPPVEHDRGLAQGRRQLALPPSR